MQRQTPSSTPTRVAPTAAQAEERPRPALHRRCAGLGGAKVWERGKGCASLWKVPPFSRVAKVWGERRPISSVAQVWERGKGCASMWEAPQLKRCAGLGRAKVALHPKVMSVQVCAPCIEATLHDLTISILSRVCSRNASTGPRVGFH